MKNVGQDPQIVKKITKKLCTFFRGFREEFRDF